MNAFTRYCSRLRLFAWALLLPAMPFLTGGDLLADILFLRNGRTIIGKIVGQTRTTVRVRTNRGTQTITKKRIRRVSYNKAEERALIRSREQARKRREAAALARKKAAEERRRREAEARRKAEEERRRREAAAAALKKRKAEEARIAALKRKQEEERKRKEAAQKKAAQKKANQPKTGLTATDRLWRSAVLPGWGMLAADRTAMGYTYMGITLGTFLYAFTSRSAAVAARADNYSTVEGIAAASTTLTSTSDRLAANAAVSSGSTAAYRSSVETANTAFLLFALAYAAQLTHSYFLGPGIMPSFASTAPQAGTPVYGLELNLDEHPGEPASLKFTNHAARPTRIQLRFSMAF